MPSGAWAWVHRPFSRLAGAAAVVALIVWVTTQTVNETPRSVRLAAPPSQTSNAMRLTWDGTVRATSYRITLRDAKGVLIFSAMAARSPYLTHEGQRSQLTVGESYTWKVESLDAAAVVIAESVPVTFRYQP